ncbi:unnamed protein product, partial [Mesorhabditis belari]|uniref:glucan 1,3-beta-glucosidase n=1 Tax=Mesorhabditis belari TaxID=2138241 RepID=A0AAF3F4I1_9BILA
MLFRLLGFVLIVGLTSASLQDVKNDIKSGKKPMHGVNLGGWLVAEHWMTQGSPAWIGVPDDVANGGEYQTMKYLGHDKGDGQFNEHRRTFITESDFQEIGSYGLNTVRIPIGYWIVGFDNTGGGDANGWKVWAPGALDYLDMAIREWGPKHNVLVFISIHAAKGSQNGNDHSSPENPGHAYWSTYPENVVNTLDVVEFLTKRYKDEVAFLGIGLLNEPVGQDENVLKQYYYDAYGRVRNNQGSDCLLSTSPMLNEQSPGMGGWDNFMPAGQFYNIRHEWHKYLVWGFEESNGWTAEKVIDYANNGMANDFNNWHGNWIFVGEWALATSVSMNDDQMKRLSTAELNTFGKAVGGWTYWAWKQYGDDGSGKNGWSAKQMFRQGFLPHF